MLGAMKQMQFDAVGVTGVLTFTANTVWVPPTNLTTLTALLVGGGGGGGYYGSYGGGGGGGAGGAIPVALANTTPSVYTITIGTGGTPQSASTPYDIAPTNGANTSITGSGLSGLLAVGGGSGGGSGLNPQQNNGYAGGSGGGAYTSNLNTNTVGNVGIAGQGFSGGYATDYDTTSGGTKYGGGGGGAGGNALGVAQSSPSRNIQTIDSIIVNNNGGAPLYSTITGANVAYAQGGGGGAVGSTGGPGYCVGYSPTSYGSGGGGGVWTYTGGTYAPKAGQAGAVILKYSTNSPVVLAQFLAVGNGGSGASNGGGGGGGAQVIEGNISLVSGQKYYANIASLGAGNTVISTDTITALTAVSGADGSANGSSGGSSGAGLSGGTGNGTSGGSGAGAPSYPGYAGGNNARVDGNGKNRGGDPSGGISSTITGAIAYYGIGGGGGASDLGGGVLQASLWASEGAAIGGNVGVTGNSATSYGSGGGGGGTSGAAGGSGATGAIILRLPTANYTGTVTGSPSVTTSGSDTIIIFAASGTYTA